MPQQMFVGREIRVEIDITADEETPVEYIDARVRGVQGWAIGSGKNRIARREYHPSGVFRIGEPGTIRAGTTTVPFAFTLPADVPPTHDIDPAYAYVELRIHVSIPWRWDGRGKFTLPVRVPSAPFPVPRTPSIAVDQAGSGAGAPRLELGLASTRLIVGESLVGSCALFHMADDEPRNVELALVPNFVLKGRWTNRDRRGAAFKLGLTLPAGSAGRAVPFEFPIPRTALPSFDALTHSMAWVLTAATGGIFGKKVSVAVPLELVDASAAAMTDRLRLAPSVADERVAAVFAAFAGDRWRIAGRDDDDDGDTGDGDPRQPAIEREVGSSVVRIAYRYRGEQGTYLVSRVDHPPLGLGLDVTPGSSLRHMFFADLESGNRDFDRAHRAAARSHDQARPVVAAMAVPLLACSELGRLVRWDDDAMTFERAITSVTGQHLAAIAADLTRLANVLDPAIAAIAAPSAVVVDRTAWDGLAGWLRGTLTVGDLSIDGHHGDLPVEVRLLWDDDGRATGVRVAIGSPMAASAALRGVALSLPRPGPDALGDATAERLIPQLAAWPTDLTDLRIADGIAAATWQLPADRTADAARVRALVEALRALLATLEPGAGPYR
jgi:hypothetical protein